ncbi:hypothetical protein [Synechococcus sp. MIT S9220]|uniref:hypothetical protein n=2 Tax=Synechococcus TaxID=1129 RepID=UPI00164B4032|nr:hypothetical protein [Synechococcus sp. MIT S9220]
MKEENEYSHLCIDDLYFPHRHRLYISDPHQPPSGFWNFISSREVTLSRSIRRFIYCKSYSESLELIRIYASFWFTYFSENHSDIYIFPSTPHRGVDNIALEVLLYLKKKVVFLTDFSTLGSVLVSAIKIGPPANKPVLNGLAASIASSYIDLVNTKHSEASANNQYHMTSSPNSFNYIFYLFDSLFYLSKFICRSAFSLFKHLLCILGFIKPVKPRRYYYSSHFGVCRYSAFSVSVQRLFVHLNKCSVLISLFFTKKADVESGDILLCSHGQPEACVNPLLSILGYPSTQCLFLRLVFPSKRIIVKHHPRIYNFKIPEFNWDGSSPSLIKNFSNVYITEPSSVINYDNNSLIISGCGSSSAFSAAYGHKSYHLVHSPLSLILPQLNVLSLDKSNIQLQPISNSPVFLTNCSMYSLLRNVRNHRPIFNDDQIISNLLGCPRKLASILSTI